MKARFLSVLAFALMTSGALAGPPILCHSIDIGSAKTLPMGSGALECSRDLSADKAVDEAIAIIKSESSPLVRMETLRRATVYVTKDKPAAKELFARVMALSLDAQTAKDDQRIAGTLFDAGFLAACYHEMNLDVGFKAGECERITGYAWIKAALDKLPSSAPGRAEMEFGAALATHPLEHNVPGARALYDSHLKHAEETCKDGSLLAANIKAHHARWDQYVNKKESPKEGSKESSDEGSKKPDDC